METPELTDEQIKRWREVILIQLEDKMPGAGAYAFIMPKSEVIAYVKKIISILQQPEQRKVEQKVVQVKKKCDHSNSITGQNGKYCLDCEQYI